ncbi:MAG: 3-dehydroquinate synthase [Oscillospiraceae bacterium]
MLTLNVPIPGCEYEILIEKGLLNAAGACIRKVLPRARKLAVVTDSTVGPLYGQRLLTSLAAADYDATLITIPAGESSKSVAMLEWVYDQFMDFGLTRTDGVVALGGGVVGDLAGFAAATILRGVDMVQIPTTLLAQVDSSVGGKVAVDLAAGKNLAGAFHQPKLVLIDPAVLGTVEDQTFGDGMAEVIKYGCIMDADFFLELETMPSRGEIMANIEHVLYTCCQLKQRVVVSDQFDTGERMLLNFGHTLGHAYELSGNYTRYTHGQAVSAGMVRAAELGVILGVTPPKTPERIAVLLACFGLPIRIDCTQEEYKSAIGLDKKGAGADISLILLERIGKAVIHPMPKVELLHLL